MKFSSFRYLVKQGAKNMGANRLMSFASVGVLTACFIITGIAMLLWMNVDRVVDYLAGQNEIIVQLLPEITTDEQALEIENAIRALPNMNTVVYMNKNDVYLDAMRMLGENANLFIGYENIFPAQFVVTIEDPTLFDTTNSQLGMLPGVEKTLVTGEVADVLVLVKNAVSWVGFAIVALLAAVSIVVVINTIRLTVFARRKEISIMKYVGATNAFIRLPFFVEGMLVGIIAGVVSSGLVCVAYYFVYDFLQGMYNVWLLSIINNFIALSDVWLYVVVCMVLGGMLLGGIGATFSVRKHLKV